MSEPYYAATETGERPDLVALLRRAFADPGQFCARERWKGTSRTVTWEYETIPAWGARAAAKALADAGLLLPPGGEVREEIEVLTPGLRYPVSDMRRAWLQYGELMSKGWGAQIMTRTVHAGSWRPVDSEGTQP